MARVDTPLRYPGGKQRLAPFIREIIQLNGLEGCAYAEPYAGGAGVALFLLLEKVVSEIHLNDSDKAVHAFWRSILDEPDRFCRRIRSAALNVDEWRKHKEVFRSSKQADRFDLGFSFFYLNRCNRSGILGAGPIGGVQQDGEWKMDARFPRNELIRRIELIAAHRSQIKLRNWDAESFVQSHLLKSRKEFFIYFDPPYFFKADRLYSNFYEASDHKRISEMVCEIKRHAWIVSYDHTDEIAKFYSGQRGFTYTLQYNAGPVRKGQEAFYFADCLRVPESSTVMCIDKALCSL